MLRLGRYQLIRKLAIGGMAEVYLAKVAGPGGFEKNVVVKRILPHLADRESFVEMFLAEARLAAHLDHPNIVHVFDFGEAEGSYFIAMEYVDGPTLRSLLKWAWKTQQPPSPSLAARIVSLASEGLAHAHDARLIHRDVSTENIMIARTGGVKVLDFGIARVSGDQHKSRVGSLKGKVAYMPPEQVRDRGVDHRVDIYALGVVLYQILTGKKPYDEEDDVSLIAAIMGGNGPVPLLDRRPEVPPQLVSIVEKAMQKDANDRYQSCGELQTALETFIIREGVPVSSAHLSAFVSRFVVIGNDLPTTSGSGPSSVRRAATPQSDPSDLLMGVKPLRPLPPVSPMVDDDDEAEHTEVELPPLPPSAPRHDPREPMELPAPPPVGEMERALLAVTAESVAVPAVGEVDESFDVLVDDAEVEKTGAEIVHAGQLDEPAPAQTAMVAAIEEAPLQTAMVAAVEPVEEVAPMATAMVAAVEPVEVSPVQTAMVAAVEPAEEVAPMATAMVAAVEPVEESPMQTAMVAALEPVEDPAPVAGPVVEAVAPAVEERSERAPKSKKRKRGGASADVVAAPVAEVLPIVPDPLPPAVPIGFDAIARWAVALKRRAPEAWDARNGPSAAVVPAPVAQLEAPVPTDEADQPHLDVSALSALFGQANPAESANGPALTSIVIDSSPEQVVAAAGPALTAIVIDRAASESDTGAVELKSGSPAAEPPVDQSPADRPAALTSIGVPANAREEASAMTSITSQANEEDGPAMTSIAVPANGEDAAAMTSVAVPANEDDAPAMTSVAVPANGEDAPAMTSISVPANVEDAPALTSIAVPANGEDAPANEEDAPARTSIAVSANAEDAPQITSIASQANEEEEGAPLMTSIAVPANADDAPLVTSIASQAHEEEDAPAMTTIAVPANAEDAPVMTTIAVPANAEDAPAMTTIAVPANAEDAPAMTSIAVPANAEDAPPMTSVASQANEEEEEEGAPLMTSIAVPANSEDAPLMTSIAVPANAEDAPAMTSVASQANAADAPAMTSNAVPANSEDAPAMTSVALSANAEDAPAMTSNAVPPNAEDATAMTSIAAPANAEEDAPAMTSVASPANVEPNPPAMTGVNSPATASPDVSAMTQVASPANAEEAPALTSVAVPANDVAPVARPPDAAAPMTSLGVAANVTDEDAAAMTSLAHPANETQPPLADDAPNESTRSEEIDLDVSEPDAAPNSLAIAPKTPIHRIKTVVNPVMSLPPRPSAPVQTAAPALGDEQPSTREYPSLAPQLMRDINIPPPPRPATPDIEELGEDALLDVTIEDAAEELPRPSPGGALPPRPSMPSPRPSRPSAPRPSAPRPSAPRPSAPRPSAPRPSAPRPSAPPPAAVRPSAPPAAVPVERPSAPIPPPPSQPPVTLRPSAPSSSGKSVERVWHPTPLGAEPMQRALRTGAASDRSDLIVRKLPPVLARLLDAAKAMPPPLIEATASLIDIALLTEDHAAIGRLLDRTDEKPGLEARFATLVRTELISPLRMVWLVERLRSGLPAQSANLAEWLARLGPDAVPWLLWAIDESEPGPSQQLFCDALAPLVAQVPGPVIDRLEQPNVKTVAALCYVLEKSHSSERPKVFAKLLGRREDALIIEVLRGRARAGGPDALALLQGSLGHRSDEVRLQVLKLLGDLEQPAATAFLTGLLKDSGFEAKSTAEKTATWKALAQSGRDEAMPLFEQVLTAKLPLLNKKKAIEARLPVAEGLTAMPTERGRALLEKLAREKSTPDDIATIARAAIGPARAVTGEPLRHVVGERRTWLARSLCIDLVMFARAASTVDLRTGILDGPLERLAADVRQVVAQESRVELELTETAATLNGVAINFGALGAEVGRLASAALRGRDVRSVTIDAPVPPAALRSMLLRVFAPDGQGERLSHIEVATVSGRSMIPVVEVQRGSESASRSHELYRAAAGWVFRERESLRTGKSIDLSAVVPMLDEWAALFVSHGSRTLGRSQHPAGEASAAWHAANVVVIGLAFGVDLGLERASLKELAELALVVSLCEAAQPVPVGGPPPGLPLSEQARLRAAWILLSQWRDRRAGSQAIAAVEAGLDAATKTSRGPGVLGSLLAIVNTFDELTTIAGHSGEHALQMMNGHTKQRFHPEMLALFASWVQSQSDLK